jgi:two-component system response regulator HydG
VSRILVIDDDQGVRDSMTRMLRGAGYSVETAETGEQGLTLAQGNAFDVILSDMRMPGISGLDVLRRLRDQRIDAAFIVMTGFGTVDTAVQSMKLGAVDFVQKPFFRDELLLRVKSVADRRQLARQVDLLQRQVRSALPPLEALVGDSEAMQRVKDVIVRAAAAPGTVLITGETGTGKEIAARAVHALSARAERAFVALNCAALTDSLLENELFGHARGAFTGAVAARSSSMRSERCRRACRPSCCARSRPGKCGASARMSRAASTCASSPPPTPTCRRRSTPESSAATSTTASTCTASTCRRCASGAATSSS